MPVLALVEYTGPGLPPKRVMERISPRLMSQYSQGNIAAFTPMCPNWRQDPTYDLAKRRRRR